MLCASPSSAMPSRRARVVCALAGVIATFWPTSALTSVDLPALGAPMTATRPHFSVMHEHRPVRDVGWRGASRPAGAVMVSRPCFAHSGQHENVLTQRENQAYFLMSSSAAHFSSSLLDFVSARA